MKQELYAVPDQAELCRQATELIIEVGREALRQRGLFVLVLTGGRTVQALYRYLAAVSSGPELREIWAKTAFFLGDERWVPAGHPDSNGRMARELLLEPVAIAAGRIFMIDTALPSPQEAARTYERTLRDFFRGQISGEQPWPRFDLALLSMGDDGHVASLFQGSGALDEQRLWVTTSSPPQLSPVVARITMTLPVFNQARTVLLLSKGEKKAALARLIMADRRQAAGIYPAARLKPTGREIWLIAGK